MGCVLAAVQRRGRKVTEEQTQQKSASEDMANLQSSMVWRALTLLELLSQRSEGIGVRDAARHTGIDRSAVSRILGQLEQLGCVQQEGERSVYTIGPRLFTIAAAVRGHDSLWTAAEPILRRLVDKHGETCYLVVRQGESAVFREKVDCDQPIRYVVELGRAFPLTTGAAGTAILAGLPPEHAEAILDRGFEQYTEQSFTDRDRYLAQLAEDRKQGYSVSMGRWVKNGAGVGAPYRTADGSCAGALTLSCPAYRLEPGLIPQIGASIREASRELSRRLGYLGPWGTDS